MSIAKRGFDNVPEPRPARGPARAEHVGSFLRPQYLAKIRALRKAGGIDAETATAIEDEAIRGVVRMQEDLGFKVVTDGEFRRGSFHLDFLTGFRNATQVPPRVKARFHSHEGDVEFEAAGLAVTGRLARPNPIFVDHFSFLKSVTRAVPKLTIPSPSIMHFRGGRAAIDSKAYPEMEAFYADLARVYAEEVADLARAGCTYLQIDETNLAYLCDDALRTQVRERLGEDPDQLALTYAALINASIATRSPEMTVMLHLCRGNFKNAWAAEGGYEPVAEVLFNEIDVDGYFLEFDDARSGGFEPLRFLPANKTVVLGLISTKVGKLEPRDEIIRRIEAAAKFVPIERLALSPQCGFSSISDGNILAVEDQTRKLELVVSIAREVWGS